MKTNEYWNKFPKIFLAIFYLLFYCVKCLYAVLCVKQHLFNKRQSAIVLESAFVCPNSI